MILQRLAAAVRRQDWFTVFIETMIVVAGVFLGLQVNNWNAARSDRQREIQIVEDLLADLKIDRAQFANAITVDLRRISAANASLTGAGLPPIRFDYDLPNSDLVRYSFQLSDTPDFPAGEQDEIWTGVVTGYFPTPSTSTYDAMIGAGDSNLIRDRDIIRSIQTYYNLSRTVITQNEKLLRLREDILGVGASHGLAPYAETPATEYFELVKSAPSLAAAIRIQATFTIFHHGDIAEADRRAAALEARLTDYLARLS